MKRFISGLLLLCLFCMRGLAVSAESEESHDTIMVTVLDDMGNSYVIEIEEDEAGTRSAWLIASLNNASPTTEYEMIGAFLILVSNLKIPGGNIFAISEDYTVDVQIETGSIVSGSEMPDVYDPTKVDSTRVIMNYISMLEAIVSDAMDARFARATE